MCEFYWGHIDEMNLLQFVFLYSETAMKKMTIENLQVNFQINAFGPALLIAAMDPVLRKVILGISPPLKNTEIAKWARHYP